MRKLDLVVILCLIASHPSNAQWDMLHSALGNNAVDFINDSTGLVIRNTGEGAFILKTTDYGINWDTVVAYSPVYFLSDVVFSSEQTAYACGSPQLILKSIDGGNNWYDPTASDDPNFADLFFINDDLGYAANGDGAGRLATTYDGGISWTVTEEGGGRDLQCIAECECYAAIGNRVFNTEDCGQEWISDTINYVNRTKTTIWAQDSNNYFLGSLGGFGTSFEFNFGSIQKTTDGGNSFYTLDFPYTQSVIDLFFIDDMTGFAGCGPYSGHPYSILKTTNGGETWGYQDVEINPLINDYISIKEIACPSPAYCYAVGGGIYRTTNAGGEIYEAWAEVHVPGTRYQETKLSAFPNPTSSTFRLEATQPHEVRSVELYNTTGQLVAQYASMPYEIDVKLWPSGCYNVVVKYDNEVVRTRVVVE
jgi:photosystem II stability/assembly factor-like uncharacterized protein